MPLHLASFLRDGDRVLGLFCPRTNRIYAVLSNLTPETLNRFALHKAGVRYCFENMLGAGSYTYVMQRMEFMMAVAV